MFHRDLTTLWRPSGIGPKASARVSVRYGLLQLTHLGFQKIVRDDQRANSRARIATASGDRPVDGGFQTIALLVRFGDEDMALFQVDRLCRMFLFCSYGVKPPF